MKCAGEANSLDPENDTVLLMEADLAASTGDIQRATELCEKVRLRADSDDGIPYVIQANLLTQQAFMYMSSGNESMMYLAQNNLKEASETYEKALQINPNCIEALTQFAQLQQLLGDADRGCALIERALKLGRSKDEVQEMSQVINLFYDMKLISLNNT